MKLSRYQKKILAYGDSNTWGKVPGTLERYPLLKRWPGYLQYLLNICGLSHYDVIEAGLSSRTISSPIEGDQTKNGALWLPPTLLSNHPVDILIIALGTNDLRNDVGHSPSEIADNIRKLIMLANETVGSLPNHPPLQGVLVSPPGILELPTNISKFKGATQKAAELPLHYARVAAEVGWNFVNLARVVEPSPIDGYHLSPRSHSIVAREIFKALPL